MTDLTISPDRLATWAKELSAIPLDPLPDSGRMVAVLAYRAIAEEHQAAADSLFEDALEAGRAGQHTRAKFLARMSTNERLSARRAHATADSELTAPHRNKERDK